MCLLSLGPSDRPVIIPGSYFSPRDFLQSSLSKMDLWRTIIAWTMCKREELERRKRDQDELTLFKQNELERKNQDNDKLKKKISASVTLPYYHRYYRSYWELGEEVPELEREIQALELETKALEQKTQALEMILYWVRRDGGKEALEQAESVFDKSTRIEQHRDIMRLLGLMERGYWRTQQPTSPHRDMSVLFQKEIFWTMREEIPKLMGMHRNFGIRNPTLETKFSTTLDKILRLSSWTPSSTHNKRLRELLRNALMMLNDLVGNEEYHDYLRDFMKQHTALCAFTLDNADLITTEDSGTTAELCKNLRRLAQNLGKIASTKAEQYQKLYEHFIAHKDDLSHWLDSASQGQGKPISGFNASPFTYGSFL